MRHKSRYSKSRRRRPGLVARVFGTRRRWAPTGEQMRNRRRLLYVAISFVILAGVAVGSLKLWQVTRPTAEDLQAKADSAFEAGEYQLALKQYQELSGKTNRRNNLHAIARCHEELGNDEQVAQQMEELAELGDHRGHLWLARRILNKQPLSADDRNRSIHHLEAVLEERPESVESRRSLVRLHLANGNADKALPHIQSLAHDGETDKLDLALAYLAVKRNEEGIAAARDAYRDLTAQLEEDPANLAIRLRTKEAAVLLGQYAHAESILLEGKKYEGDQKELDRALSQLYVAWAIRHRGDEKTVLEMLAKSVRIKQAPSATFTALRELCARGKTQQQAARSELLQALVRNDASPAMLHNVLADLATLRRESTEAQMHWELAAGIDPIPTSALNNLAVSLLRQTPPNPTLALSTIERALALSPNMPQLKATRGRVLLRMGRWEDARDELNSVLAKLDRNPAVQLDLAEACLQTGFAAQAQGNLDKAIELNPRTHLEAARMVKRAAPAELADQYVKRAVDYFQSETAKDPKDLEVRLAWAESLVLARQFAEAETVLRDGQKLSDDPRLITGLAHLQLVWTDENADASPVQRVLKALAVDASNRSALYQLVQLIDRKDDIGKQAQTELEKLLANDPPAELLVVLGTRDWVAGRLEQGRKRLEQAYAIDPEVPDLRNNLAWALLHTEPKDLARSLELVTQALDHSPHHPNYRGTRGHVFAHLERWDEAKADLEYALQFQPDHRENKAMLAKVKSQL